MGRTSRSAVQALSFQGLTMPPKPTDEIPVLPEDVTELDDSALMALYTRYVAWNEYSASQLAMASVDEREAEISLARVDLRTQAEYLDQGEKITSARALAKTSDAYIAAQQSILQAEAYRKVLESVVSATEKNAALVSRELTRRTAGAERTRRASGRFLT